MATTTKTAGFQVPCPLCGAAEGLTVKVTDMTLQCVECSEEVSRKSVEKMVADAQRLLRWLDAAESV